MQTKNNVTLKKIAALLLAAMLVVSLTACDSRSQPSSDPSSDDATSSTAPLDPLEPPDGEVGDPEEPEKDIVDKIVEAYNKNNDVVGWLKYDNTTIDDVVLQGDDNIFYERSDITKQYNWYGCYYADAGNFFGTRNDLTTNTIIYGHNMSDKTDDVKLSQLMKLIDFDGNGVANAADDNAANPKLDFAKNNPVIHFSTVDDDMVWIIYAAFYTDTSFQYHLEKPDTATFQGIIDGAKARSELIYDVDVKTSDKILTLSTCCYRFGGQTNKDQRFVVQARLLRPGEQIPTTATVAKNPSPQRPVFS